MNNQSISNSSAIIAQNDGGEKMLFSSFIDKLLYVCSKKVGGTIESDISCHTGWWVTPFSGDQVFLLCQGLFFSEVTYIPDSGSYNIK